MYMCICIVKYVYVYIYIYIYIYRRSRLADPKPYPKLRIHFPKLFFTLSKFKLNLILDVRNLLRPC